MADVKQNIPLQAKLMLAVVFGTMAYMAYGCNKMFNAAASAVESERRLDAATAFTVEDADSAEFDRIIQMAVQQSVILKIKVDREQLIAELHVLPAIRTMDVDAKSKLLDIAYRSAFGLPQTVTKFGGLMYVMDGTSGKQLQTLDLKIRGTAFREW